MKKTLPILSALLVQAIVALAQDAGRYAPEIEARIKQVEQNLAVKYRIKGQPAYTLKERMAH
ncbi:MAG TPA: hypothetical protein VNU70_09345, partial [Puia sp.]|nr:hypothetical protein [Puia sp.]